MKLGERGKDQVKTYTVRLGEGCNRGCPQCGAFPAKDQDPGDFVAKEVTAERIRECLTREFVMQPAASRFRADNMRRVGESPAPVEDVVEEVRYRLADTLANYVTTDTNQEPLDGDAFLEFAKLVRELTGGRSHAVCISHGLMMNKEDGDEAEFDEEQSRRLDEIIEFMGPGDVFVVSLDFSRSRGNIHERVNFLSYLETLKRLKKAMDKGVRVTVSVQGNYDSNSPAYIGKAMDLNHALRTELERSCGWNHSDIASLRTDIRKWVNSGRAQQLSGIESGAESPVIPDADLVNDDLDKAPLAGYLDAISGRYWVHVNNAMRTYNDVTRLGNFLSARGRISRSKVADWEEYEVNDNPIADLTAQFERRTRLLAITEARTAKKKAEEVPKLPQAAVEGGVRPRRKAKVANG